MGRWAAARPRYVELWNLVFQTYDRQASGELVPFPKPGIDTGAGFERMLTILQGAPSVWETDVLRPLVARAEALTGRTYGDDAEADVALRVLADHARTMSFMISDGVFPSNEDRGYVLRRIIRRAVLRASLLGTSRPVCPGHGRGSGRCHGGRLPRPGQERRLRLRGGGPGGGALPLQPALRHGACSRPSWPAGC